MLRYNSRSLDVQMRRFLFLQQLVMDYGHGPVSVFNRLLMHEIRNILCVFLGGEVGPITRLAIHIG
jgi:hypothetical protein